MQQAQRESSSTFRKLAQRFRVTLGFLIVPLLFIAAKPTPRSLASGLLISLIGLAIRAWASGYLKKNQELTVTGPYAYTRNPLYFGTFILALGVALSTNAWWFVAVFVVLYLLIYVPVMQAEAETLNKLFPAEYASYRLRVPMFLPRLAAYKIEQGGRRFTAVQYLKHREYRAALGVLIIYALLAGKMLLLQ